MNDADIVLGITKKDPLFEKGVGAMTAKRSAIADWLETASPLQSKQAVITLLAAGSEPLFAMEDDLSRLSGGSVKKGQPLFTAAPIGGIGLGAGTQDNEMPDAVRQYMANPTLGLLQDEEERKKLSGLLFR